MSIRLTMLVVLCVAALLPAAKAQQSADAFIAWARANAVALDEIGDESTGRIVATARVVALGEPAHGAHEPLQLRNRLFQYLVEQLGFTAIALESGLTEARIANDFVTGGDGEAEQVARKGLTWGFGEYPENAELLRWMRKYNASAAHGRKVRFYGIDLSGTGSDGGFSSARVTLDEALSYLVRVAPELSRETRHAVMGFLGQFTQSGYVNLSVEERVRLRGALASMLAFFERERSVLVTASGDNQYQWAKRNAVVATQIEELFRLWPQDTATEGVSAGLHNAVAARDLAMADNVQWILEREGLAGRVLVFAHNAHVMNAKLRGGVWDVYPQAPTAMGQHLRQTLDSDLLILGTSSADTSSGLPLGTHGGGLDAALAAVGHARFLLDLREAKRTAPAASWLRRRQRLRANFTTYIELSPLDAFDAVIFLDRLTASQVAR